MENINKAIWNILKNIFLPSWLLIYLMILGCSTDIEVQLPYDGNKLVINGILNNKEPISFRISHSVDPNGPVPQDLTVTNAQISLHENGKLIEDLSYNPNTKHYESATSFLPKAGHYYFIRAAAPGYLDVQSDSVYMSWPISTSISSFEKVNSAMNPGIPALKVYYSIYDSLITNDYYAITTEGYITELGNYVKSAFYRQEDFLESGSNCYYILSYVTAYDDACINGSLDSYIEMQLDYIDYDPVTDQFNKYYFQNARIGIHRISPEYYEYIKYKSNVVNGIETVFLEQPQGYTNIQNGYGVLMAMSSEYFVINY